MLKSTVVNILVILILSITALYSISPILLREGTPGLYWDWETGPFAEQMRNAFISSIFNSWQESDFGSSLIFVGYPARLLLVLLMDIGFGTGFAYKSYLFLTVLLSGISMYYLIRKLTKISRIPALIASVFYQISPFVIIEIIAGHAFILFSYAFTPFCIAFFAQVLNENKKLIRLKYLLLSGLAYFLAGSQLQWILLIPCVLFIYLLNWLIFNKKIAIRTFLESILHLSLIVGIGILLYIPWVLIRFNNIFSYAQIYANVFSSPEWLLGQLQRFTPINTITATSWFLSYSQLAQTVTHGLWLPLILITVSLALVSTLKKLTLHKMFFLILFVISWTLLLGSQVSFSLKIWQYLYYYLRPVVTFLGEFYNLNSLIILGLSFLLGLSLKELSDIARNYKIEVRIFNTYGEKKVSYKSEIKLGGLFLLFMVLFTAVYLYPTGLAINEYTQNYTVNSDYKILNEMLSKEGTGYRALWLPAGTVYGATYLGYKLGGEDPLLGYSSLPSQPQGGIPPIFSYAGGLNAYLSNLYNTIYMQPSEGIIPTTCIGKLLSLGAFKYVINRNDVSYAFLPTNAYSVSTQFFSIQKDLINSTAGSINVYINNEALPILSAIPLSQAYILAGGFDGVNAVNQLSCMGNLPNYTTIFFASQLDRQQIFELPLPIIIVDNGLLDLLYGLLPTDYKVQLYKYAYISGWQPVQFPSGILTSGWTLTADVNNPIMSTQQSVLDVPVDVDESAEYLILLKVFYSPESQGLSVKISNYSFTISTQSVIEKWSWLTLGPLMLQQGNNIIQFFNLGGLAAISLMAVVPIEAYAETYNLLNQLLSSRDVIQIFKFDKGSYASEIDTLINYSYNFSNEFVEASVNSGSWIVSNGTLIGGASGWSSLYTNVTSRYFSPNFEAEAVFNIMQKGPDDQNYLGFSFYYGVNESYSTFLNIISGKATLDLRRNGAVQLATGIEALSTNEKIRLKVSVFNDVVTISINGENLIVQKISNFRYLRGIGLILYGETQISSLHIISYGTYSVNYNKHGIDGTLLSVGPPSMLSFNVYAPNSGNYQISIRYSANESLQLNLQLDESASTIGINLKATNGSISWYNTEVYLNKGWNHIIFRPDASVRLDAFLINSFENAEYNTKTYLFYHIENLNNDKYSIIVDSNEPFFIIYLINYDQNWELTFSQTGYKLMPVPVNGFGMAYLVDEQGTIRLTLQYMPQNIFLIGWEITLITLITICALLSIIIFNEKSRRN